MKRFWVKLFSCFLPTKRIRHSFRTYFFEKHNIDAIIFDELRHPENAEKCVQNNHKKLKYPYSIGIVTYNKRFDTYFKPLIHAIRKNFTGDIIVCINGTHNEPFDEEYRKKMLKFLSEFDHIYPMFFTDFRSLGKLWNNCLINSPTDGMLLLNDDVSITDEFWSGLTAAIIQNKNHSFKINGVWCHIFLNRKEVDAIGWFDERLLGVGYEDTDFEARWFKKYKKYMPQISDVPGLVAISDNSNTVINQRKCWGKYSLFNKEFFIKKFQVKERGVPYEQKIADVVQYPYENFYWSKKHEI
ncbi:MAG: hypothetical protein E7010_03530 [Alphaproteobacteria bacterium]|nr:hypothetical protein [Alphaproteobacteria bacterium]